MGETEAGTTEDAEEAGSAIAPPRNPFKVEAELSIRNSEEIRRLFMDAVGQVLDLSGVVDCDAAAFQLIYSLRKTAVQRGQYFQISALSSAIETTAAALGLPIRELVSDHSDDTDVVAADPGGSGSGV